LEDALYHLALSADRAETQVAAACRLHDILCGKPKAMRLLVEVDGVASLSDVNLLAELHALEVSAG
jgi:hypothetical protein